MNCVLFAKMDQVFSKENKRLKNTGNWKKNTGKVREKSGNFVSPEKWEPWKAEFQTRSVVTASGTNLYPVTDGPPPHGSNAK